MHKNIQTRKVITVEEERYFNLPPKSLEKPILIIHLNEGFVNIWMNPFYYSLNLVD